MASSSSVPRFPSSDPRDADSRSASETAHGESYQPGRSIPADAAAQFGNLSLAVRVIGNLKRFADLQRRQFLGVFAPLGRSGQRFPRTVDYVLIMYAEGITAERIDSVSVFAPDPSLSQKLKPRPSRKRRVRRLYAIFPCYFLHEVNALRVGTAFYTILFARPAFQGNNHAYRCARLNTKKNTITVKEPNA
jgi:hypothetical protein